MDGGSSDAAAAARIQRLIDDADQSINLLSSFDVPVGARPSGSGSSSGDAFVLLGASASSQRPASNGLDSALAAYEENLTSQAVDISVLNGFLHIKGVFPDHSVEYVDIEPRFTTIGEMKQALCSKRDSASDLGFAADEASVMVDGQRMEDDWLVVDCGMSFDGVIYIVRAFSNGSFFGGDQRASDSSSRFDPKLSIASISSTYAQSRKAPVYNSDLELSGVSQSLALAQISTSKADVMSRHIRPEEATFAEIASDFYERLADVQDTDLYCEELLRGYIDVLQARLEGLEAKGLKGNAQRFHADIKELRDERNTWRLLYELRRICHPTEEDQNDDALMLGPIDNGQLRFDMLEDDAIRMLETGNENYKIQQAVKTWLENVAMENTMSVSEKRSASSSRTLRLMKKQLHPTSKSGLQMDPDSVLRDGDSLILDDDAEDEAELMKCIWLFVRAGKMDEAVDLCIRMGQSWRAASLTGGTPVGASETNDRDAPLERWGNPFRALWKTTCWRLSEPNQLNLSKDSSVLARQYEEIIYAALSGNVDVLTHSTFCGSWEDHCWAYLQGITAQQQDEILFKLLKVKLQSSQLIVGNNAHHLKHYHSLLEKTKKLKRYEANLDTLFEELKGSKNELVRAQANEPFRHIQAKLVTGKTEFIVNNVLNALLFNAGDDSYNWDLQLGLKCQADDISPMFLRFAVHFVLFAAFTGERFDDKAGHMILKLYIRHLVKHRQLHLVPVYASRLPVDGAIEIYVQVLASVEDHFEREMCVKRILENSSMDVLSTVVQRTVERLLKEYRPEQSKQLGKSPSLANVSTSETDRRRMRSIEYLCFYNEHRAEALYFVNLLARQFVMEGKLNALTEFFVDILPEDLIGVINLHRGSQTKEEHEIDHCVREFLCWQAYIQACGHYDLWRNCVSNATALSSYTEEKDFLTELMFHNSRATTALLDALHFENGWMVHRSGKSSEDATIRQLCLPLLVFNLHFIQLESAKVIMRLEFYPEDGKTKLAHPLLEKSLEVADVVADEHYGVYKSMTEDQCRDLLHSLRDSSIALLFMESSLPSDPSA